MLSDVAFSDIRSIQVTDLSGQIVNHTFTQTTPGTGFRLSETAANGAYLLVIRYNNGGMSSGRLLLQKK